VNTSRPRSILVVLAAMAALTACGSDGDSDAGADPDADSSTPTSSTEVGTGTLALTADGSAAGKCKVPSAETLSTFDTAFAGTVTSLDSGTATLAVDQWYAGDEAATVTVESPSKELEDLLMAVDFQQGKSYLVSATGGRVTLCGFTAEENPELQAMYDEAFAQ
jgi:hypothetical protein